MKIVFTGGGTGGHFYPLIAVAQKVNQIIDRENIIGAKLYYISDNPYDRELLFENGLIYEEIKAGKMSMGFSFKNFISVFKMISGTVSALSKLFSIYPDVVFSKGGYASFPVILAAKILNIPILIHESDSVPGRVNKLAGYFAKRIAVSLKETAEYFPMKKVAWTGHPIRAEIEHPASASEAFQYYKLESSLPVILVLGGSLGAELINNAILDALPRLINNFQIIHQIGVRNFKDVSGQAQVILATNEKRARYLPFVFLNSLAMKMAVGAATVIISRAGSTLFEIASWGVPSIVIPITTSIGDHQRKNALNYAHAGACVVVEEANMTANVLSGQIERIVNNKAIWKKMAENTKNYNKPDAAYKIARELIDIVLSHEK